MSKYCLEPLNSNFTRNVKENYILIAGENFGCGSAREIAPTALKHLKVGTIIAKSFARTFFRNAITIGLPVLISKDALNQCNEGDILEIDLKQSQMRNITTKEDIKFEPIDSYLYNILSKGDIFPSLK